MIDIGTALRHYKRKDVQDEMLADSKNKEVVARFGDKGFGKRPDTLNYPSDIIEQVKNGATSFHISEERWKNPLQLTTPMTKKEMDDLRIGWDLVIDIDFEIWEITKMIGHKIINALKEQGISSISCKFSGNKGFHIGVPFEAFPEKVHGYETRLLFPEATKRVVSYLADYIDSKENNFQLSKKILENKKFNDMLKDNEKNKGLIQEICLNCGKKISEDESKQIEFICPKCGKHVKADNSVKYMICEKDNVYMERIDESNDKKCPKCGSKDFGKKVNLFIDTLLVSPRHLYRMNYSLHEKSGLASIPILPKKILEFKKQEAIPEKLRISKYKFLDKINVKKGEAAKLIIQAFDYNPQNEEDDERIERKEYEPLKFALQEEFFPPCIKKGLKGLKDGKKRFSFLLINFLTSVGWDYEKIEKIIVEWNKKNEEPLREADLLAKVRYHKTNKKKILPPNCNNAAYYKDIGICEPDNLCNKIKNPVNYSRIKARSVKKSKND
ncbi:MAG: hypothetical protein PHV16_00600 [Candidatus Nanoarchaeia archaeon]|nr:hypothetical protein [Candidatus Nanoarchaeia archaeon]